MESTLKWCMERITKALVYLLGGVICGVLFPFVLISYPFTEKQELDKKILKVSLIGFVALSCIYLNLVYERIQKDLSLGWSVRNRYNTHVPRVPLPRSTDIDTLDRDPYSNVYRVVDSLYSRYNRDSNTVN